MSDALDGVTRWSFRQVPMRGLQGVMPLEAGFSDQSIPDQANPCSPFISEKGGYRW